MNLILNAQEIAGILCETSWSMVHCRYLPSMVHDHMGPTKRELRKIIFKKVTWWHSSQEGTSTSPVPSYHKTQAKTDKQGVPKFNLGAPATKEGFGSQWPKDWSPDFVSTSHLKTQMFSFNLWKFPEVVHWSAPDMFKLPAQLVELASCY